MALWRSLGRPLCGFRLLDSGKSSLYPSVLCRVKRTHIANQMKSVQRANGSLAQSGAAAVRLPLIGLGQVFVVPECPLPCQAHPHRESNEESPESQWLFGAVWGAAAVRLPPFAPADSPRKAFQSQCGYAKAHKSRAADSVPRPPSGSPPENAQSRSKPTKPDNHTTSENALLAIPTHGGIGTQHFASRPVWRYSANSRRDRTQDIPIEPYDRCKPNAKHSDRNA